MDMPERSPRQLILLPGLLNDAELWRDQIAGLSDIAACHVADLTRGQSLRELAEQVLGQAPAAFALAGFSFGGYVAVEIARLAPGRVERLALLDTSIRTESPERAAMRRAMAQAARLPGEFQGMTDRVLPAYVDRSRLRDAELVGRIKTMTRRLGREVFLRQSEVERNDGEAVLRSFRGPVLVLCGANDILTPPAEHRAMAAMADDAQLVIVEGSGHMTPMEQPEAVTQALRAWLVR